MRRLELIFVLTAFCLRVGVSAQEVPKEITDPIELLRKASDAVKAEVIQYNTTVQPFGYPLPRSPRMEGTVLMSGWRKDGPAKFKYDITFVYGEASGGEQITIGSDGETYYLLEHGKKKVHEGRDHSVFGAYTGAMRSFPVVELVKRPPLENELVSGTVELQGSTRVGNEDCREIKITYRGRQGTEALWYFSKKTFLLRRVDIATQKSSEVREGRQVMLADMVLNPKFDSDPFNLQIPPGYEKVQPAP